MYNVHTFPQLYDAIFIAIRESSYDYSSVENLTTLNQSKQKLEAASNAYISRKLRTKFNSFGSRGVKCKVMSTTF